VIESNFRTGQSFKRRRERKRGRVGVLECVCCAQEEEEEEEETLFPVESCGCVPISRLCLQQRRRILVGYIPSVELGARALKENIIAASGFDEVINYQNINCYVIWFIEMCFAMS
jgi:hypothetical protein